VEVMVVLMVKNLPITATVTAQEQVHTLGKHRHLHISQGVTAHPAMAAQLQAQQLASMEEARLQGNTILPALMEAQLQASIILPPPMEARPMASIILPSTIHPMAPSLLLTAQPEHTISILHLSKVMEHPSHTTSLGRATAEPQVNTLHQVNTDNLLLMAHQIHPTEAETTNTPLHKTNTTPPHSLTISMDKVMVARHLSRRDNMDKPDTEITLTSLPNNMGSKADTHHRVHTASHNINKGRPVDMEAMAELPSRRSQDGSVRLTLHC